MELQTVFILLLIPDCILYCSGFFSFSDNNKKHFPSVPIFGNLNNSPKGGVSEAQFPLGSHHKLCLEKSLLLSQVVSSLLLTFQAIMVAFRLSFHAEGSSLKVSYRSSRLRPFIPFMRTRAQGGHLCFSEAGSWPVAGTTRWEAVPSACCYGGLFTAQSWEGSREVKSKVSPASRTCLSLKIDKLSISQYGAIRHRLV